MMVRQPTLSAGLSGRGWWLVFYRITIEKSAFALVRHDVEYHIVGGTHGILSEVGKVFNGTIHILVDDAFSLRYVVSFHRHHGRQYGSGYSR